MNLCRRCVCVLHLKLLWVQPLCASRVSQFTTTAVSHHQRTWIEDVGRRRTFCVMKLTSDQQRTSLHPHTGSSTAEEKNDRSVIVPFNKSDGHLISNTLTSCLAGQTKIDLDAAPYLSPFEEVSDEEAIQITVSSDLPPATLTLRDYVDKSETLSKLVQLGVDLSKLEQRPNVGSLLVRLDFQVDVAPRLLFLKDLGVEERCFGPLLTKNPFILTESLDNLEARVSYLKSMQFSQESVAAMVSKAPYLLNFSVKRLDNRLGFFQQQLGLSAHKTRDIVIRLPRLLCGSLEPVKENLKVCELEFGFRKNEIQHIIITVPKVLTANKRRLTQVFNFIHNTMGVPHSLIAKFPQALNSKFLRIKERHLFLTYLGHAHYDPSHPDYISLERLVSLPDQTFCSEVALASLEDFERFQKTM